MIVFLVYCICIPIAQPHAHTLRHKNDRYHADRMQHEHICHNVTDTRLIKVDFLVCTVSLSHSHTVSVCLETVGNWNSLRHSQRIST